MNGRRKLRAELETRMRIIRLEPLNTARKTAMLTRKRRRDRARELGVEFRPVYGYLGVPAPDHKEVIAAMKFRVLMRDNVLGYDNAKEAQKTRSEDSKSGTEDRAA